MIGKKALLRATVSASLLAVAMAVVPTPATAQPVAYQLRDMSLSRALREFGRVSGQQIIFAEALVRGRRAPALVGVFAPEEALGRLLAGSGLQADRTPSGAYMIVRATPAPGEDPAGSAPAESESAEQIVVTGTRIRGASPAAPVTQITRADIEQSGQSQIGEILRNVPQNFSGGANRGSLASPVVAPNNFSDATLVNLRGAGADATLVLVNGNRIAIDAIWGGADVGAIPLSAIERVDIVTDGASALYGSDAVAGVVNFILRTDFEGAEVSARLGGATQGGGFEQVYNGLVGHAWSEGNILAGVEYLNQGAVRASQREFTSEASPLNTLFQPQERVSAFGTVRQQLGSSARMEVTALYASRRSTDTQDLRSLGFNYVGDTAADTESFSVAPQLSIDAWSDWDFSVRGVMAESSLRATTTREGAVPSGFGVFNELRTLELSGTGTLISLPNGGVRLAVGAGYREEEQRYTSVSGFVASRDVRYVYGEVLVPLVAPSDTRAGLNRLELSLAGRLEDYSDFGSSANPRVGLRYSPLAGLNLRGTWGRSFKAPLFRELYGPNVVQALPAIVYGSSSPGNVLGMNGGNPDLGPERSTSWTVGFDWRRGINISATYFNTSYRDRIVVPFTSGGTALIDPASAAFVNRSPTLAEINEIVSSATTFLNTTGGPYDPGSIIAIVDARFVNAAAQRIRGVDISMSRQFRTGLGDIGVFTNASWLNFSQRTLPTLPATTRTGLVFYPAQFRARGGVTYRTGNLTSSIAVNHVSGSTDNFATPPTDVSAWTTVDLSLSYHFPAWSASVEGLDAALSVTNLFDNDPPFVASGGLRYPGFFYDSSNTSAMGRFVAATIRQRF